LAAVGGFGSALAVAGAASMLLGRLLSSGRLAQLATLLVLLATLAASAAALG
jgi:hypothetical protein